MPKTVVPATDQQWIDLTTHPEPPEGAKTFNEIRKMLNLTREQARALLEKLMCEGKCTCEKYFVTDAGGRKRWINHYVLQQ